MHLRFSLLVSNPKLKCSLSEMLVDNRVIVFIESEMKLTVFLLKNKPLCCVLFVVRQHSEP